jgi:hypothetical protein
MHLVHIKVFCHPYKTLLFTRENWMKDNEKSRKVHILAAHPLELLHDKVNLVRPHLVVEAHSPQRPSHMGRVFDDWGNACGAKTVSLLAIIFLSEVFES